MRIKKRMMNKIILSGDTVQIELIDGEENTSGTWIVEHDEDGINDPDDLIETQEFIQYG
jgi:hypothetical protein